MQVPYRAAGESLAVSSSAPSPFSQMQAPLLRGRRLFRAGSRSAARATAFI